MAAQLGGVLLGQAEQLLRAGFKTSEGQLTALYVGACGIAAYFDSQGADVDWRWSLGPALVIAAFSWARGMTKEGAVEVVAKATEDATVRAEIAADRAPTLAERGRRVGLPLVVLLALLVAACQPTAGPTPMQDSRAVLAQSCRAYASVLEALAAMNRAGDLSNETVARVDAIRWQVGPVCEDQPADPTPYIEAISRSVNELVAIHLQELSR